MQLFDDPRYKAIRKKYDPKTMAGMLTVFASMFANAIIHSAKINFVLYLIEFGAFGYLIKAGVLLRRELKELEATRKSESM
jgi:hypothetical protein